VIKQEQSKYNIFYKLENLNWPLISLIIILAFIGFLMLYSAGGGNFRPWLLRQFVFFIIFFPIMLFIALTNIKAIYHSCYFLYAATLILLIIVDISGHNAMGATRWFRLGPITVQPSEIMKVFTVFALAKYFYSIEADQITKIRTLIVPALIILVPAFFIFHQPDLGTASILVITGVSTLFLAGVRLWKFITAGVLTLIAIPLLWHFFLYDYQKQRVLTFLNPESDPLGSGYNIIQSKIAIGSGGIIGKGYLHGTQGQLNFLPEKQTDFIFTMLAEELGLIGSISLIGIYMAIILMGIKIAVTTKHQFGRLLVMGIMNIFFLHMFINMAMVMGLIPVVGAPLPFISYGGTIMATMMIGFGLVLNIDLNKEAEIKN
jgi:rod shape determining protein RodA